MTTDQAGTPEWPADLAALIAEELTNSYIRGRERDPRAAGEDRKAAERIMAAATPGAVVPVGEAATIHLPGSIAIRVIPAHRVIAVDYMSMNRFPGEPLIPEWLVEDLRKGQYGDFHSLRPVAECFDAEHARSGEHATAEERATVRDTFGAEQVTPVTEEG